MKGTELALLGRTAAHLRPAQVAHRARLRAQRRALHQWPQTGRWLLAGGPVAGAARRTVPGWPAGFVPLDGTALTMTSPPHWPSPEQLQAGRIQLLGSTRPLAVPGGTDWAQADAPQLWRFHLYYWDWAWGLAAAPGRDQARELFGQLWRSWRAAVGFGRGDAWLPYPAALRAWSWCGLFGHLVAGTDVEPGFLRDLGALAGFLRRHLESDVGGNHLVKDLKALIGLGVFLGDEPLLRRALRQLTAQLAVQILADGGHYERAPAYHCQVLADLIDVADLLSAAGRRPPPALTQAIAAMRRWLGAVLTPDGAVPLLNDGYPVPGPLLTALRPLPPPSAPLVTLRATGLARVAAGGWHVLADVGAPCPGDLPAHAHADTLGCLVHVDGAPLLVDTGTSTYAAGPVRSYERSTAAHNTLEIDGADSTEVWGAFRAGRRARVRGVVTGRHSGALTVQAVHDGYRQLPGRPLHRRRWALSARGLRVEDRVTGTGRHMLAVRWHLAPGAIARIETGSYQVSAPAGEFRVTVTGTTPLSLDVDTAPVAAGFGQTTAAPVLTCRMSTELPAWITTDWLRAGDARGVGDE